MFPERSLMKRFLGRHVAGAMVFVVFCVQFLVVTCSMGFPAFQDFGEWIYQARVVAGILAGEEPHVGTLITYPVPYFLPQALLSLCELIFGAVGGSTVFLFIHAAAAAWVSDLLVVRRALPPVMTACVLAICVLGGSQYWNGYVGLYWGMVIIVGYLAVSDRNATRWPVVMAFALATFFTHGIIFGCWGLVAGVRALTSRRIRDLIVGVVPAMALVLWYFLKSNEAKGRETGYESITHFIEYRGYTLAKSGGYQNIIASSVGDHQIAPWLFYGGAILNFLFAVLLVVLVVLSLVSWSTLWRTSRWQLLALVSLGAIAAIFPPYFLGIVNPGERVVPTLIVVLILMWPDMVGTRVERAEGIVRKVLCLLLTIGLCATVVSASLAPRKVAQGGGRPSEVSKEIPLTSAFGHRLDQFREKVDAARAGDLNQPLAWTTSILVEGK
ncbi:hypothetical protein KJZ00_03010 [Cutibacterium avidum]|nr:hypothetical protein [Cutibacterium avidum]MCO6664410.1 hypothetical protein [Cutibacterium avidum]OIJ79577.1 hypothetical protein APY06_09350 [Cutibacterium avidum]